MGIDKEAVKRLLVGQEVKTTEDLQVLLRDLTKEMIDAIYEGELTSHLGYDRHDQLAEKSGNYRNGHGKKTVKSHLGEIELSPPRDRLGAFDPEIVRKRQTDISGLEMKVISMYGKGMSTRDIRDHIYDIYGYDLSAESVSAITDKVIETSRTVGKSRPLERLYAIVFTELALFEEKWDQKYRYISKSWRKNWPELSTFYKYPPAIRKLIYTTNPIESFNRGIRKVTKTRPAFPTENALLKLIFLAVRDIERKWTHTYEDWGIIYAQLLIYFEEILKNYV